VDAPLDDGRRTRVDTLEDVAAALAWTMATDPSFATFVTEQASDAGDVRVRRMFGEYALYLGEKVVGLLCDDQLFLKPTDGGRALLERVEEAPPYPGAKPYFLLAEELDDRPLLAALLQRTADELPEPKPKKPKKPRVKRARG
jgi:TfoX/Sxy family transcriptional regulator of competence genes